MLYKAKVAVCSENTQAQCNNQVEFLNDKTWRYVKKPLGFERLKVNNIQYVFLYQLQETEV